MKSISVFCGSSMGTAEIFKEEALKLGQKLAENNIGLVYGGAKVGLMGAVADGTLQNGGTAIGILPHFLQSKEIAHEGLSELILVNSMHERKTAMFERCEGIIALPGGFGTIEELFEMLTWAQLGLHKKPIGLLNINGFYTPLLNLLEEMVNKGFLKTANQQMLLVSTDTDDLLHQMKTYKAPDVTKWIQKETT